MRCRSIVCALVTGIAACHGQDAPLVLGAAGPWSTDRVAPVRRAIQHAVDEINHAGGIRGRPLAIRWVDDSLDGRVAITVAESLVADPQVLAVVGHITSSPMVAAAPLYDGRLPVVAPMATSPDLVGVSPWVFRLTSNDSINGVAIAQFTKRTLHAHRAVVLFENDTYGRGISRAFIRSFADTIVMIAPIDADANSYEPYVSYLRGLAPDVVFVAGGAASGSKILREAKRQQVKAAFIGGDAWTGVESDTVASEGAYMALPFSPDDPRPEVRQFVDTYRARFHEAPAIGETAYEAVRLIASAIATVGPSRSRIRAFLAKLDAKHSYAGIWGQVYFLPTGDPATTGFVVTHIHHGSPEVIRTP
jgi:branched-chain amino acid transport system substrate-binding protein